MTSQNIIIPICLIFLLCEIAGIHFGDRVTTFNTTLSNVGWNGNITSASVTLPFQGITDFVYPLVQQLRLPAISFSIRRTKAIPKVYAMTSIHSKELPITIFANSDFWKPSLPAISKYCKISTIIENPNTKMAVVKTGILKKDLIKQ